MFRPVGVDVGRSFLEPNSPFARLDADRYIALIIDAVRYADADTLLSDIRYEARTLDGPKYRDVRDVRRLNPLPKTMQPYTLSTAG